MAAVAHAAEYSYFYFSFTGFGKAFRGLAENARV